ncbi:MAG: hypothetical protein LIO94_06665, partial [Clostridiales bacterium]|nr:hypothetical protein [Clostridiales bacterium]
LGDSQASFLGSVGIRKNVLLLNMGTGGQISALSDCYFEAPGIEARPFIKGKYLLTGSSLCGGRAYAILEHFFRSYMTAAGLPASSQYSVMAALAEKGRKTENQKDRMRVRTTFNGTRMEPELRGAVFNLSEDNFTPEGLVYGVLEGMARELYDMYCTMSAGTVLRAESLVASGNGLRMNPSLQEICQDMFGVKLTLSEYREEAACGAAFAGTML